MIEVWTGVKQLRNYVRRKAVREANQARDSGDTARAAALYQTVLDRCGPHFDIFVQLGNMLKDSRNFERAEKAYKAALRLNPLDADCHLQLGHLMKVSGRADQSVAYYREANRLSPVLEGAIIELRTIEHEEAAALAKVAQDAVRVGGDHLMPTNLLVNPAELTSDRFSRSVVVHQRLLTSLTRRRN